MIKQVLRLLWKLALLLVICGLVAGTFNHFYTRTNEFRSQNSDYYRWLDVPAGLTVVNVGSSHGQYGFDYSGIAGVKGFNFALNAQDFYYDMQVLKHFKSRLAPGCIVIIPVSYFSLGISEADVKKQNIDARYSPFLDYGSIKNRNILDYVKQRYFPAMFSSYRLSSLVADKPTPSGGQPASMSPERMIAHAQARARRHLDLMSHDGDDRNIAMLGDLISYCRSSGLKPVLLTTPFTGHYTDYFGEKVIRGFGATVAGVGREQGVSFTDFSRDQRFSGRDDLFIDSDHLNQTGRRLFTGIVVEQLRAGGLLPQAPR